MKKIVKIKESELVSLIEKIITETVKKKNISEENDTPKPKKNVKRINLTIDSEKILNLIKKTPTLRDYFHDNQLNSLKVGENKLSVNNYIYSRLKSWGDRYWTITDEN